MKMRLNSYIARCGICSRRQADIYIADARVRINGHIVTALGLKVEAGRDKVEVDGKIAALPEKNSYYAFHKPVRVVTTMDDPQGRATIRDYINDIDARVYPIGRLDYDSEGLLLLTDDGELSHRVQHPRHKVRKEYLVETDKPLKIAEMKAVSEGLNLDDGPVKALSIWMEPKIKGGFWYRISLNEGRKRIVRRIFEKLGYNVLRLKRIAVGNILLGRLASGAWRKLKNEEIEQLKKLTGLS